MRALLFMEVTVIKVRQYGIVGQVIFKGVRSSLHADCERWKWFFTFSTQVKASPSLRSQNNCSIAHCVKTSFLVQKHTQKSLFTFQQLFIYIYLFVNIFVSCLFTFLSCLFRFYQLFVYIFQQVVYILKFYQLFVYIFQQVVYILSVFVYILSVFAYIYLLFVYIFVSLQIIRCFWSKLLFCKVSKTCTFWTKKWLLSQCAKCANF